MINEAQSYANGVIPEARGIARRILEEATGYKEKVVAEAEGEANRFEQLLAEYSKAPEVTRQRLYLDAIQDVMGNSTKVMVGTDEGNNILYLPLDKAMDPALSSSDQGQRLSPSQISTIVEAVADRMERQSGSSTRRELR